MGTPIPWPVLGPSCLRCWGPGAPFAPYVSPLMIQATVTGMVRGINWTPILPEPPNGMFELVWVAPCNWIGTYPPWTVSISYTPALTVFQIDHPMYWFVFHGTDIICKLGVDNNLGAWSLLWDGGSASWTWLGGP